MFSKKCILLPFRLKYSLAKKKARTLQFGLWIFWSERRDWRLCFALHCRRLLKSCRPSVRRCLTPRPSSRAASPIACQRRGILIPFIFSKKCILLPFRWNYYLAQKKSPNFTVRALNFFWSERRDWRSPAFAVSLPTTPGVVSALRHPALAWFLLKPSSRVLHPFYFFFKK